jgi:Xaa-Pro aminopeptidase
MKIAGLDGSVVRIAAVVVLVGLSSSAIGSTTQDASTSETAALREDLTARRARLMATLTPGTMGIFWSAPTRVYSRDVDYEYRQDSDLLYLTGVAQPETILVLVPGSRTRKEFLFIRPPDARREHWEGHFLTVDEARAQTGIDTVFLTTQFDAFLSTMFNRRPFGLPAGG